MNRNFLCNMPHLTSKIHFNCIHTPEMKYMEFTLLQLLEPSFLLIYCIGFSVYLRNISLHSSGGYVKTWIFILFLCAVVWLGSGVFR